VDQNRPNRKLDFYHIPKTGGRYFEVNTLNIVKYDFIKNGIPIKDKFHKYKDHKSFKFIEDNPFAITLLRNPVDRTISHYFYVSQGRQPFSGNIKIDKKNFFDYIEKENHSLHNFQAKSICNQKYEYFVIDDNVKDIVIDNNLIKDRLSKINILIKTEDIDLNLCNNVLRYIYKYFDVNYKKQLDNIELNAESFKNEKSNEMRQSLTKSERSIIEGYMEVDMEIYETSKFFAIDIDSTNNG